MRQASLEPLLLVDIGGTHTRCAVGISGAPPRRIVVYDNAGFVDLESVIAEYLEASPTARPGRAALAVAAPVTGGPLRLTNRGWRIDGKGLKKRFGFSEVRVVNDFEALACALPALGPGEVIAIHPGTADPEAALAVLGPGTGLGVSGLVPCGDRWYPIRGEGGHVTLAAGDDEEAAILGRLRRAHGHVSAERVLSGPGLLALYAALCDTPTAASSDQVSRLAAAGDRDAGKALELFFRLLATVCGDLALTLGARGGVYLGGGILPALREQLMASGFVDRYRDKGRFSAYLAAIPVSLIIAETPALRGLMRHPDIF